MTKKTELYKITQNLYVKETCTGSLLQVSKYSVVRWTDIITLYSKRMPPAHNVRI